LYGSSGGSDQVASKRVSAAGEVESGQRGVTEILNLTSNSLPPPSLPRRFFLSIPFLFPFL
jgi:hypothetical protein